jgi:uncharacterized protein YkwD
VAEHPIETIDARADERRVVRKLLLIAVAAGFATACGTAATTPTRSDKSSACGQVAQRAADLGLKRTRELTLCLLNEERAAAGLGPLRYDLRLEAASQAHSDDMVSRRFFDHETPEGMEPYARMAAAGYPATNAFTGENLAWGEGVESAPVEIVDTWMHSPPHREAILHPGYSDVGVGVTFAGPESDPGVPAATYTTDFGGPPMR